MDHPPEHLILDAVFSVGTGKPTNERDLMPPGPVRELVTAPPEVRARAIAANPALEPVASSAVLNSQTFSELSDYERQQLREAGLVPEGAS